MTKITKAFATLHARFSCVIWLAQHSTAEACERHAVNRHHLRAAACHVALAVLRLVE